MRFRLDVAGRFYKPNDPQVGRLKELGFRFKEPGGFFPDEMYLDYQGDITIEIGNMKELFEFMEEWGTIVVRPHGLFIEDILPEITIYNDYLE
jgi:hypothetical protein